MEVGGLETVRTTIASEKKGLQCHIPRQYDTVKWDIAFSHSPRNDTPLTCLLLKRLILSHPNIWHDD